MQQVETLILGVTMAGVAATEACGESCLLIGRSAIPGYEFAAAFEPGFSWDEPADAPAAVELEAELRTRKILIDRRLHLGALPAVLCQRLCRYPQRCLLATEVVDITRDAAASEYVVTIANASGISTIAARRIIDTNAAAPVAVSLPQAGRPQVSAKTINAVLHLDDKSGGNNTAGNEWPELVPGRFASEAYFRTWLDLHDEWPEARTKLVDAWAAHPARKNGWRIATIALTFSDRIERGPVQVETNWTVLPSIACGNPLAAFAAGSNFGRSL